MVALGLAPKKSLSQNSSEASKKTSDSVQNSVGEDAKQLAAAALAAVRDAALNSQVGKGKIQVSVSFCHCMTLFSLLPFIFDEVWALQVTTIHLWYLYLKVQNSNNKSEELNEEVVSLNEEFIQSPSDKTISLADENTTLNVYYIQQHINN
jgi:hypothetical protein